MKQSITLAPSPDVDQNSRQLVAVEFNLLFFDGYQRPRNFSHSLVSLFGGVGINNHTPLSLKGVSVMKTPPFVLQGVRLS